MSDALNQVQVKSWLNFLVGEKLGFWTKVRTDDGTNSNVGLFDDRKHLKKIAP